MTAQQRIVRVRRNYNKWVANETLEDYALRFTSKSARKFSRFHVANTAIGAVSFLALEAIGGALAINYGLTNASLAIFVVGFLVFLTGIPIAYYASTYGVDIDLLTRGAGFGYIGSTITSLIYASFTFIFFALEAAIMSLALELCFGIPLYLGYVLSSLAIIPIVTHGITLISRFQMWTQGLWLALHFLPFAFIAVIEPNRFADWIHSEGGIGGLNAQPFNLILFGTASMVVFSLIAQIGEQVDFLRFLPAGKRKEPGWWLAWITAGPGWVIPGMLKMLAGSFLAYLAIQHGTPYEKASEPTQMYLVAFQYVSPQLALILTGAFVIISQLKINVTNAYAGSIAWSNFFSRLTHSHPGRVVWVVFNVAIALALMEIGIFKMLDHILGLYSIVAVAWVGALVSDLIVNKPLGWSPAGIEFKRAHLYDINPVGVGAMVIGSVAGFLATFGALGDTLQPLSAFLTLIVAFAMAPLIAIATRGRYYIAREPRRDWGGQTVVRCSICELPFETEDMAHCPVYSGPICSLCCSLESRCRDGCKPHARIGVQAHGLIEKHLPQWVVSQMFSDVGRFIALMSLFSTIIGLVLYFVYIQVSLEGNIPGQLLQVPLLGVFFILSIIAGVAAWLFVLAQDSRRVAEEETHRQTELLMNEIEAHKVTDAKLEKAKEAAEAANDAKSRHVVGLSHELRTPLNAILGYSQILERDPNIPTARIDAIKVVRRSAEHLSGLIDGLLDISKIEAGRFHLNTGEVRIADTLNQIVDMVRLQALSKGLEFQYIPAPTLPEVVSADEKRLRQILINLLSNAIKFTEAGRVTFRVTYRSQVAEFTVSDTGIGIHDDDIARIFQPFEHARTASNKGIAGTGLGLTITKLLASIMGGELTVSSEVGRWTTFRVRLLLSAVWRPRTLPTKDHLVRGYTGPHQTILVVDDNETQRDLMRDMLTQFGFRVLTAANGPECLVITAKEKPNLILLDIAMPDMDGWAVMSHLRRTLSERPAIVAFSANAIEPNRLHDGAPLYDDYLMKPVELRQLLQSLHTLLNIEWIYEDPRPSPKHGDIAAPPAGLKADEISDLIQLGQIGHVRRIRERLDEIETDRPQLASFLSELRNHVRSFELNRYVTKLEKFQPSDTRNE